jgi:hypothetical protein
MKSLYAIVAALLVLCVAQVTEANPYGYGYGMGVGCGSGCGGGAWNSCNYDHLWAGYCGRSQGCGTRGWRAGLWSGGCGQSACCNTVSSCRPRCSWLGGLRLRRVCGLSCGNGCGCGYGAATASCGYGCGTSSYGTISGSGCCGGTSGGTVITHEESIETAPADEAAPAMDPPPAMDEAPPVAPSEDAAASLGRYNWSALQSSVLVR